MLLAGFLFGIVQLLALRFEEGDVYPPYSSLRADPLGVKAFYAGLENLPDLTVKRIYLPAREGLSGSELPEPGSTTLFYLGVSANYLGYVSEERFQDYENFVGEGGRWVISLLPVHERFGAWSSEPADKKQKEEVHDLLKLIDRQALHAKTIGFVHPATSRQMKFDSELPQDMEEVLKHLHFAAQ